MTQTQLDQVVEFARPYYKKTGRWHAWDHIVAVRRLSLAIAETEFPHANMRALEAAATIHDMGRTIRDEGHGKESGKIAKPFLESIKLPEAEIDIILDAVTNHEVHNIDKSKSLEARIMYDADKIEIFTAYGFMRVAYWLVEERHMELGEAVRFLWEWCEKAKTKLYSTYAKTKIKKDTLLLEDYLKSFNDYEKHWRK